MKYSSIISAFLIGLGLVLSSLCLKSAIKGYGERDRVVTVRGLCEKEVQANKVTWPLVTKEMGNDLPTIYDRIQATNDKILQFLKSNGISADEISVNSPDVTDRIADRYSDDNNISSRYSVTNVIVVTSSKVDLVRKLIDKQADLLRDGIAVIAGNSSVPHHLRIHRTQQRKARNDSRCHSQGTRGRRQVCPGLAQQAWQNQDSVAGPVLHKRPRPVYTLHQKHTRGYDTGILS